MIANPRGTSNRRRLFKLTDLLFVVSISLSLLCCSGGIQPSMEEQSKIVLQVEYRQTHADRYHAHSFGRVPQLTLYSDRTVFYTATEGLARHIRKASLTESEYEALLLVAAALDCDDLREYARGTELKITGSPDAIVTFLDTDGGICSETINTGLRHFPIQLDRTLRSLDTYDHPASVPYVPDRASMFVWLRVDGLRDPVRWPLSQDRLRPPAPAARHWVTVLKGEEIRALLGVTSGLPAWIPVQTQERTYKLFIVPWLPGADYTPEIQRYQYSTKPGW